MDKEAFLAVDRALFDRLNQGPIGRMTVTLRNGGSVVGAPKGIARGTALGGRYAVDYWGRILMVTDGREVEVDYADIAAIT